MDNNYSIGLLCVSKGSIISQSPMGSLPANVIWEAHLNSSKKLQKTHWDILNRMRIRALSIDGVRIDVSDILSRGNIPDTDVVNKSLHSFTANYSGSTFTFNNY